MKKGTDGPNVRSEGKAFGAAAPIPYQVLRAVELHGWGDQSCSIKSFGARSIVYALTDEGVANQPAFVGDLKASTDDFFRRDDRLPYKPAIPKRRM